MRIRCRMPTIGRRKPSASTKSAPAASSAKGREWSARAVERKRHHVLVGDPVSPVIGARQVGRRDRRARNEPELRHDPDESTHVAFLEVDHEVEMSCRSRHTMQDHGDATDHDESDRGGVQRPQNILVEDRHRHPLYPGRVRQR